LLTIEHQCSNAPLQLDNNCTRERTLAFTDKRLEKQAAKEVTTKLLVLAFFKNKIFSFILGARSRGKGKK
jgi:hypothetical protein